MTDTTPPTEDKAEWTKALVAACDFVSPEGIRGLTELALRLPSLPEREQRAALAAAVAVAEQLR
jgi:hypothetical protein